MYVNMMSLYIMWKIGRLNLFLIYGIVEKESVILKWNNQVCIKGTYTIYLYTDLKGESLKKNLVGYWMKREALRKFTKKND